MSDVAMPTHHALQLGADRANPFRLAVFREREVVCQRDEPGCTAPRTPHPTVVVCAFHARYFASASLRNVNPPRHADNAASSQGPLRLRTEN
jgi:hypothetical protein